MPSRPKPKTAHGQRLADFLPLLPAEEILREACRMGEVATIGTGERPEANSPDIHIRAEVLRVFCLDRDPDAPVHEHGVQLVGAWIIDDLDLEGCVVPHPLYLVRCYFAGSILLRDASTRQLGLDGSASLGMDADRLDCSGGVFLRDGFTATRKVRLSGATIGGNLECTQASFEASDGNVINADGAKILGSVFFNNGFVAKGQVHFLNAQIGGILECSRGSFEARDGDALCFDRATIAGSVFLNDGFAAKREVRLLGATIGGNLECRKGNFEAADGYALSCDRAKISGSVLLGNGFAATREVRLPGAVIGGNIECREGCFTLLTLERARIKGSLMLDGAFLASEAINLGHAEVDILIDASGGWTNPTLVLDGLTWHRFGANSATDAASRITWLDQQPYPHRTTDFRPQPWEQCAKVLAEMGHEREATKIRIEKRKRMRMLDWRRSPSRWAKLRRVPSIIFDFILWLTVAYGYRPLLAGLWLLGLWIVASLAFTSLVPPTVMTPTDARVYLASTIPDACRDDWVSFTPPTRPTDTPQRIRWSETFRLPIDDRGGSPVPASWREICTRAMPSEYTTFSPWVYTLDLLLPIVDLRQEKDWAPRVTDANGDVLAPLWSGAGIGLGHVTRFGEWSLILLGWFFSALLLGAVTGIIRRD